MTSLVAPPAGRLLDWVPPGPLPSLPRDLLGRVGAAGVTGRGGAGFPLDRKLSTLAAARGPKVVVANGTEGEPLSAKDKTLLVTSPHLVLDGLDAAAAAIGARRKVICIERGNPSVLLAVRTAINARPRRDIELVLTPRRYISGQESALVALVNGRPGRPTLDRPFERGVGGRPTLVDNVETLAQLALVARGLEPATNLVTVAGAVSRPGVYELPRHASVTEALRAAGGRRARAVLVGGYFGCWYPPSALPGGPLGPVVAAIDDQTCAVAEMARVAEWFAASSAGQCGACTWGLRDLAGATAALSSGSPDPRVRFDITRWTAMVRGRGACALPDGAAMFLESGVHAFADEIAEHQASGCRRLDLGYLPTPVQEAW